MTKERSIRLHAHEVCAILAGQKTVMRQVVRNVPSWAAVVENLPGGRADFYSAPTRDNGAGGICADQWCFAMSPYGAPGDHLWVKETWAQLLAVSPATGEPLTITAGERLIEPPTKHLDASGLERWNYDGKVIAYRASSDITFCDGDGFSGEMADRGDMPTWRSSIHMPRWASRLTLAVTDVRVERLHTVTEQACRHEGVTRETAPDGSILRSAHEVYAALWDAQNKRHPWSSNPWTWRIAFARVTP